MTYVVYWLLWKQPQLLCDRRVHNRVCTLKQSILWISSLRRKKGQNEKQVSNKTSVTDTECTTSVTTRNVWSSRRNCAVRTVVALCCVGTYEKNQYRTPSRAIFSEVDVTRWMYQARTHRNFTKPHWIITLTRTLPKRFYLDYIYFRILRMCKNCLNKIFVWEQASVISTEPLGSRIRKGLLEYSCLSSPRLPVYSSKYIDYRK
jgi:hypothetical protein